MSAWLDLVWYSLSPSMLLQMVLEWGSVQGQRVDSCLTLGSKLRSHMDWPNKRLGWKAAPMWRTAGKGNSSAAWLSIRFDSDGVSLPPCLGQSSFLCLYLVLCLGVLPGSLYTRKTGCMFLIWAVKPLHPVSGLSVCYYDFFVWLLIWSGLYHAELFYIDIILFLIYFIP